MKNSIDELTKRLEEALARNPNALNEIIRKSNKIQKECGKIGHTSDSEWFSYSSGKMNGVCTKCGELYERTPTPEEREKYTKRPTEHYMETVA